MAQIDFRKLKEQMEQNKEQKAFNNQNKNFKKVGYFNLKDDGDTAIVKFAYTDVSQFDVVSVHNVSILNPTTKTNMWRFVSCLRQPQEPIDNCPFCASGLPLMNRFFVKLVRFDIKPDGEVEAIPEIWSRPLGFCNTLVTLLEEYGFDTLFKIKRNGAHGNASTTYDVLPASPKVYNPELFKMPEKPFEGFDLSHHSYLEKTKEDMEYFLEKHTFPVNKTTSQYKPTSQPNVVSTEYKPTPVQPVQQQPVQPQVTAPSATQTNTSRYRNRNAVFSNPTQDYGQTQALAESDLKDVERNAPDWNTSSVQPQREPTKVIPKRYEVY